MKGDLHVLGGDGDVLPVDADEVGVFVEVDEVVLEGLLDDEEGLLLFKKMFFSWISTLRTMRLRRGVEERSCYLRVKKDRNEVQVHLHVNSSSI